MPAQFLLCSYCNESINQVIPQIEKIIEVAQPEKLTCENTLCKKQFLRKKYEFSLHNYCSRSCAVSVNNKKFPKNPAVKKICITCKAIFSGRDKYCSVTCKVKAQTIQPQQIIEKIKQFYKNKGRIPLKREFPHEVAARRRFGSWNKAILAAELKPNKVMFSKKYSAKDGHKCDSLAEMLIDNWLFEKCISHQRSIAYPEHSTLTVDFVIGDYWIEFFGLHGQHKRYEELRKEKLQLATRYKIKLIELYPHHLFPQNKLSEVLEVVY